MRMSYSEMKKKCPNLQENLSSCNCSYTSCDKTGLCCQCVHYHRQSNEIPACFFPDHAEKTWDRSFRNFINVWKDKV
ncbi:MAG: DUF6485 family protein [bacterium]